MTDDEDALLAASRKAYQTNAKLSTAEKSNQQVFLDGTDIIRFEDNDDDAHKCGTESTKPVKQSSIKKQGKQREKPREDLSDAALHALEVTSVTPSRRRSKREIEEAQTQGGKSSFTGGDAREATEKELRQQIQAIRLRNALDPKRFYRGSAGTGAERGMPAYAQLGRIVGGGLEPSSILNRSQRSETVVGELGDDPLRHPYPTPSYHAVLFPQYF
ncbi:unnamed protein product [Malassezia sympodialis ATCC 42132]|uniref:uncharacterized protein n=1 Tax=Malassezia sympodialis (strain ATCC 42132) TaxID=1230383 RepID=UPI0002C256A0|nr:uncharacterized protein MSY001_0136 [Malassezia sympodialis ATCC 42132]CCU97430.1 unnamed protein product [Malassezia sympodialis ATCC 42132]|eukprot:XP_018738781.1 uncharacterized protein MSY001_0136 [Malassezia sympodialis ATCC 42132]